MFEIRSTDNPYNMAPWCKEKSYRVVEEISYFLEWAKAQKDLPEQFEETQGFLHSALANATKLLAFSCNAEWTPDDPSLIIREGQPGYETILVKYGILNETTASRKKRELAGFVGKFTEYIQGERVPIDRCMNY